MDSSRATTTDDREVDHRLTKRRVSTAVAAVPPPRKAVGYGGAVYYPLLYQNILTPEYRSALGSRYFQGNQWGVAVAYAHKTVEDAHLGGILPIFCDGSALHHHDGLAPMEGGYSVVFPDQWFNPQLSSNATDPWHAVSWPVEAVYESMNAELLALCEALSIALFIRTRIFRWMNTATPLHLAVFNDKITAVELALQGQTMQPHTIEAALAQPIVTKIVSLMHDLQALNCWPFYPWIPGHDHGVKPHRLADNRAKHAAKTLTPSADGVLHGYTPVGPGVQSQVMQIALRHPAFDAQGRRLSKRGEELRQKKALLASQTPI